MAHVFQLGDEQLIISDALAEYNQLRQEFMPMADEAEKIFKEIYQEENEDFESLLENFPEQVVEALNPVIDACITKMIDNGIYDVSREIFVEQYCVNYISIIERFEQYLSKYNEINGNMEAAREYREYRKATRGMFIGGGFGVKGAIKGAMTAGALNMATGLAHSLANGIGNMWDRAVVKHTMEAIFNDPLTLCDLANSVWESAFNMHYAYLDVIEERKGTKVARFSMDNIPKSNAIYQNISRLDLPFEKAQKPLCEMFSLQPYEYEYYQYTIMRYGDREKQLEKIGEFFNINMLEMKLVLLNIVISQSFNYKEIDSDLEERLQRIRNVAEHFGIQNDEIIKIENRIRSSFYAYKFSSSIEENTGLYLPTRDKKEKFMEAYGEYKKNIRAAVKNVFDTKWHPESTDGYFIGPDEIENMDSDYEDYLLMYSVNSERDDFLLKLSDKMLEYGRGKVCRITQIKDVKIKSRSLVINDEIWVPFSCEELNEELTEDLFRSIINIIQNADKSRVLNLLNTYSLNEQDQQIIDSIDAYLWECEKKKKAIVSTYSILRLDDIEHLMAYYNICEKMKLQTGTDFSETPIILFKNSVTTSMLDESYSDEEYNQSMFKVTGDEYALFTSKSIVFTAKGAIVPIDAVKEVDIDEEDGSVYITYNSEKYTITNFVPEANEYIQKIVEKILAIYGGERVVKKIENSQPVEAYMADIYVNVMNYAKKRVGKREREAIFSHIYINCNNESFDELCAEFQEQYAYLKDKEILFFAIDDVYNPDEAVFVTKEGLCYIYETKFGFKVCGFHSHNEMLPLDKIIGIRNVIDREDEYKNKICLDYYDESENNEAYTMWMYCLNKSLTSLNHNVVTIINMMIDMICEKENIKRISKDKDGMSTPVFNQIKMIYDNMFSLHFEKYVFVLNPFKGNVAPYDWVDNASKYYDGTEKPVLFLFNDALIGQGGKGIVITPKTLYYSIVPDKGCIAIKDILEIRSDDGKATIIETKAGRHVLIYSNPGEISVVQLTNFISELVFLLQESGDRIEDELKIIQKKRAEKKEERAQKGVFNYVQRQAVAKIKKFYLEHPSLGSVANFYFNDGTKEFEDKIKNVRIMLQAFYDNIEVPLIAVHVEGNEKKEGFLLTNERWYHMVCSPDTYSLGIKGIKWVKSEPDLLQTKDIIYLRGSENDYRVCKVEEYQTKIMKEFLKLIISSTDELSGKIDLSQEEIREKENQLNFLVNGYEEKSSDELKVILRKIQEEYPFDFAAPVLKIIEEQIKIAEDRELIEKLEDKCKGLSNMNLTQLDILKKELSKYPSDVSDKFVKEVQAARDELINKIKQELDDIVKGYETMNLDEVSECEKKVLTYPSECHISYIKPLDARKNELYNEKWTETCKGIETFNLEKVEELLEAMKKEACSESIKDKFMSGLYERQEVIFTEQISELVSSYETMSIEQLKDLLVDLEEYPRHLTVQPREKVSEQLDELYRQKIAERSKNLESMSIEEVSNLQEMLKQEDCNPKIKKAFEPIYEEKIRSLYTELLESWYQEVVCSDYLDAENVRQKIVDCTAPTDIKNQYVEKTVELVKQLYKNKYSAVYSFARDITKQRNLAECGLDAIGGVVVKEILQKSCKQYNYWEDTIVLHHVSKLLGYSGYVFTPDRFYIYGSSTIAYEIDSIARFEVVKKLMGSDIVLRTNTGIATNLNCKHGKNVDIVADTLNQILFKLRPGTTNTGTASEQQNRFCTECGKQLIPNVKFCSKCGAPVN